MAPWLNQYIPLVQGSSGRILEESDGTFSSEDISLLQQKCREYCRVAVEIGSGSGMHLLNLAEKAQDTLCIGFELRYKRTFRTIEKADQRGISNIFMVRGDARGIENIFHPAQIDSLYLHYPDPWGKARWLKHRLVQPEFVSLVLKHLKPGGTFSFRTDHREYFLEAMELLTSYPELHVLSYSENLVNDLGQEFRPSSEFESLFFSNKVPLNGCVLVRGPLAAQGVEESPQ